MIWKQLQQYCFIEISKKSFSLYDVIDILSEIKPHISSDIVKKAYADVEEFKSDINLSFQYVPDDLADIKFQLYNRIKRLMVIFKSFNVDDNSKFILKTLNYLNLTLRCETLDNNVKKDLFDYSDKYLNYIDEIVLLSNKDVCIFAKMNLKKIKKSFERLNDYISQELNINVMMENFKDEFDMLLEFVSNELVPNNENLVSCDLYISNDIGNPSFEYYIQYKNDLPYEQWRELYYEIIGEMNKYCISSGFPQVFRQIYIFLVKEEDLNVLRI